MQSPSPNPYRKLDWGIIKRLLQLAIPHKRSLLLAGVLGVLATVVQLALPYVAKQAVDEVGKTQSVAQIDRAAALIIGLFLISATFGFLQFVILSKTGNRIVNDLRKNLFAHLQRLPVSYFDKHRSGDLTSFLSNDVSQVQTTVTSDVVNFAANILKLIGGIVMAVVIDWKLCLFVVALLAAVMAMFVILGRRLRLLNREALDRLSEAIGQMTEALGQIRLVKAFAREKYEDDRTGGKLDEVYRLNVKSSRWEAGMGTMGFFGFIILLLGVLWYGGRGVIEGNLTIGAIVGFFLVVTIISGPMGELASLTSRLQRATGAAERLFEILDEPVEPEPIQPILGSHLFDGACAVRFEDIHFAYVEDQPILKGLTLDLPGGKTTALVGASGSGKTTVSALLYRFYDPQAGAILIDGQRIDSVSRPDLRAGIGVVPQETQLFAATIKENIRYGRLDATDAEIEEAARAANVEEFVLKLPDGYETMVGERGITLSGGQRQRVAIARAILKDPKILILDEATSSLDTKSEKLVQEAIDRLASGRTTLVIAHRLSTVENADQIVVLADGQVVEEGNHSELLAKGGAYADLLQRVGADGVVHETS